MEQIGVEAVVEGLLSFGSDMESIQKAIEGVNPSTTILGQTFDAIGGMLSDFGASVVHVAEYAIGGLLKDAVEGAISYLGELGSAALTSGENLQTLEIRLNGLNTAQFVKAGQDQTAAMDSASKATKEQLDWLQKLSAQTSFSPDEIANTYTLARTYDFTDEQARQLTESIINFTAGMGLSDEAIKRIIINLGQMQQQGKVTQRDLNDLARGAFVPVNEILNMMTKNLQANGQAASLLSEPIQKLKDEIAGYAEQLAIAKQKQDEYNAAGGIDQTKAEDALQALKDKLTDYQHALEVAIARQADFSTGGVIDQTKAASALQALKDKLTDYQHALDVATARQASFTSQTSEATKLANQYSIDKLRREIEDTTNSINTFDASLYTVGSATSDATRLANQFTIDKLRREIEDTAKAIDTFDANAYTMGTATKDSVKMANQAKIDDLQKKIDDTTAAMNEMTAAANGTGKMTQEMFDKMKKTGLPVVEFMKAFEQLVGERFGDSAKKMTRTMQGAIERAQQFAQTIIGWDIFKPILDNLGGRMADFFDVFTTSENVGKFKDAGQAIADAVNNILTKVLGLLPNSGSIVDNIITGMQNLAAWLNENSDSIVQWVKDLVDWISNKLVPFIRDQLIPAIAAFIGWIADHQEQILGFFRDMASWIVDKLAPFIQNVLVPAISEFIGWLTEHQGEIIPWLETLAKAFLAFVIIQYVASWVLTLVGGLLSLGVAIVGVVVFFTSFAASITTVVTAIGTIAVVIAALVLAFKFLQIQFTFIFTFIAERITQFATMVIGNFFAIRDAIMAGDWGGLGKAIIDSIADGIKYWTVDLVTAIVDAAQAGMSAFRDALGMHSPSKVFMGYGQDIMAGVAEGIANSAGLAVGAMRDVVGVMSAPMINLPSVAASSVAAGATTNSSVQNTNNFNLSINSSASTEPVVQDFAMMQSLAGG